MTELIPKAEEAEASHTTPVRSAQNMRPALHLDDAATDDASLQNGLCSLTSYVRERELFWCSSRSKLRQ